MRMGTEFKLPLRMSVNVWNAVRFIILEVFVSVIFSALWNLFVRRSAAHQLRQHNYVKIFTTNLGRFTPAEIGFSASSKPPWEEHQRKRGLRYCLVVAVNVVLFALLLLLEYGSTDTSKTIDRTALLVTENSIRKHMAQFANEALSLTQNPPSVLAGFQESTELALRLQKTLDDQLPSYVLDDHVIDSNMTIAEKKPAVTFADVCGDGDLMRYPECQKIHRPLSGQKDNGTNLLFANVTRVHPFVEPFRSTTRVYDVEMQDLGFKGTCHGHRFQVEEVPGLEKHYTVQTNGCVLKGGDGRVYAVFPDNLTSPKLKAEKDRVTLFHLPGEPDYFVRENATVMFETTQANILSFVPSIEVETLAAALHLREQGHAYNFLSVEGWDFPVFTRYRRHIMLLCLALSGEYFESVVRRFETDGRQAAVNEIFIGGLGSLLALSVFLVAACLVHGSSQSASVPVGMRPLLRRIRSVMCASSEGIDERQLGCVDLQLDGGAREETRASI